MGSLFLPPWFIRNPGGQESFPLDISLSSCYLMSGKEVSSVGQWIVRLLLFLICGASGYFLARGISSSPEAGLWGALGGFLLSAVTILLEGQLKKVSIKSLAGSFVGLIIGVMFANFITNVFLSNLLSDQQIILPLYGLTYGVCGYIGLRIGLKKGEEVHLLGWKSFSRNLSGGATPKILDTSVIIDGRISDITEA